MTQFKTPPLLHAPTHEPGGSDRIYYDKGHRQTAVLETLPRQVAAVNAPLTTQILYLAPFTAEFSLTVAQIIVAQGTTSPSGITYAALGLYTLDASDNATLVGQTGDIHAVAVDIGNGSTANFLGTISTMYGAPLKDATGVTLTPYACVRGSRYAVGTLVVASTTAPSLRGIAPGASSPTWMNTATFNGTASIFRPYVAKQLSAQSTLPNGVLVSAGSVTATLLYAALAP